MRAIPISDARWPRPTSPRAWLAERSNGTRLHAGVDLGYGREVVVAPEDSIVRAVIHASYAGDEPRFSNPAGWAGYGPFAVLLEGPSEYHLLAHVTAVTVRPGDVLEAGDSIATVAPRGNHLHWEVRRRRQPPRDWATVEIALDPQAWLDGRQQGWSAQAYGCPPNPVNDRRTPRACRPEVVARDLPMLPRQPVPAPAPEPGIRMFPPPARLARPRPGRVLPFPPLAAPGFRLRGFPPGAAGAELDAGEPAPDGSPRWWSSFS